MSHRLLPALILAAGLLLPTAGRAQPANSAPPGSGSQGVVTQPTPAQPQTSTPFTEEAWQARARQLRDDVAAAEARYAAALDAYKQVRHKRKVRGQAKRDRLAELEAAEQALAEARERRDALPDEARRAGVPPGWIRLFD